jgi:hypothetical protein
MSELERVSAELRKAIFEVRMPLQTTKELNVAGFERLERCANELAHLLRGSEHLPRKIVNDLYSTAKAMENEAPYAQDQALVSQWASKLYMTFDLILLGESHDDYKSGVPRAI